MHVDTLCLKAARLSGIVARLFSTRNRKFLMKLFLIYIRPSLEYASITWNPREISANKQLERVQRRLTRRIFGWSTPSYDDRLALFGVPSLNTRRKMLIWLLLINCCITSWTLTRNL